MPETRPARASVDRPTIFCSACNFSLSNLSRYIPAPRPPPGRERQGGPPPGEASRRRGYQEELMDPTPVNLEPAPRPSGFRRLLAPGFLTFQACVLLLLGAMISQVRAQGGSTLSAPFERLVMAPAGP